MTKWIIDRSKWARGGRGGISKLLNPQGNMCCLGQICRQAMPDANILGVTTPSSLRDLLRVPSYLVVSKFLGVVNSDFTYVAMEVNDRASMPDKEREKRLTELFKSKGDEIEFVGEYVGGEILL